VYLFGRTSTGYPVGKTLSLCLPFFPFANKKPSASRDGQGKSRATSNGRVEWAAPGKADSEGKAATDSSPADVAASLALQEENKTTEQDRDRDSDLDTRGE
jgi:hypothetical protein